MVEQNNPQAAAHVFSEINALYDHFSDFIHSFEMTMANNGEFLIKYCPWTYDLLDHDLDFDEFAYMAMMSEFDRFVDTYSKELAEADPAIWVSVIKSEMVFRHKPRQVFDRVYRYDAEMKRVSRTTSEWL